MRAHVAVELVLSVEALLADGADEGSLARMDHVMPREMRPLGEPAAADFAVARDGVDGGSPPTAAAAPAAPALLAARAAAAAARLNRLVHQSQRHANLLAVRRLRCLARRPACSDRVVVVVVGAGVQPVPTASQQTEIPNTRVR